MALIAENCRELRADKSLLPLVTCHLSLFFDSGAAVAAKLHRQRILETALRADVLLGGLGLALGAAGCNFPLDEGVKRAHRPLRLLRSEHKLGGLCEVILAQRLIVLARNFPGLVLELQVLDVFVNHQPPALQVGERSHVDGHHGLVRDLRSEQRSDDENNQRNRDQHGKKQEHKNCRGQESGVREEPRGAPYPVIPDSFISSSIAARSAGSLLADAPGGKSGPPRHLRHRRASTIATARPKTTPTTGR